jgi:hypothetical protein
MINNGQGAGALDVIVAFLLLLSVIFGIVLIHLIRNKGYINLPKTIDDVSRLHEVIIIMYKLKQHREILKEDMSGGFAYKLASSVSDYMNNYIIIDEKEKYILANRTVAQICKELRFFPTQSEKEVIEKYLSDNILMKYLNKDLKDTNTDNKMI